MLSRMMALTMKLCSQPAFWETPAGFGCSWVCVLNAIRREWLTLVSLPAPGTSISMYTLAPLLYRLVPRCSDSQLNLQGL